MQREYSSNININNIKTSLIFYNLNLTRYYIITLIY